MDLSTLRVAISLTPMAILSLGPESTGLALVRSFSTLDVMVYMTKQPQARQWFQKAWSGNLWKKSSTDLQALASTSFVCECCVFQRNGYVLTSV